MAWQSDSHPTLYFVDLDRFKNINDSLGHAAGDEVLMHRRRSVSQGAAASIAIVARLSGDEYVVLDPRPASPGSSLGAGRAPAVDVPRADRRSARATSSSRPASASPRSSPIAARAPRTCCATPTRPCTAPRTPAATAWRSTTSRCTSASPTGCRSRQRCTVPSIGASCASSTSRSSISNRRGRRLRGAHAVAAGRRHHRLARRVHPHRRRDRHHHRRSAPGHCSRRSAAAALDRRRRVQPHRRRCRSTCRRGSSPIPTSRRSSTRRSARSACRRTCCGSR